MYKLLIVEDEPIERQGIKLMIENNCPFITKIDEAENGLIAIQKVKDNYYDVIMMDINMPGLNGLETIKEIRSLNSTSRFIVLTSHDRFDFAYEAIQLGVEDYVLKPAKISRLKQSLEDILKKIEKEKNALQMSTNLKTKVENIRPVVEKKLIHDIAMNSNAEGFASQVLFLGFSEMVYFCICIHSENISVIDVDITRQKLLDVGIHSIADVFQKTLVICIFCDLGITKEQVEERVLFINLILTSKLGLKNPSIGVSDIFSDVSTLHTAYRQSNSASLSALRTNKTICFFDGQVPENMDGILNKEEITEVTQNASEQKNLVVRVLAYIDENYTNNISLQEVAHALRITPYYLSKLIKKHTGTPFPDLINEKRVVDAKKLLLEDLSIKEIAYEVGFQDQNYFSKIFKKHIGMTPSEYRDLHSV